MSTLEQMAESLARKRDWYDERYFDTRDERWLVASGKAQRFLDLLCERLR